jgi:3-oxoacyl-[acyl-carrier protein] reductase
LARSGLDIWLTYHQNHAAAGEVKTLIESMGRTCDLLPFDVADHAATKAALMERTEQRAPDVVVFNAGIARDNLFVWMTKPEWDTVIATNLNGFYNVINTVLFPMLREKCGRIVVISSTSGQIGQAGQVNYSASKAGLIGAVKALAREVGRKNLLVNVVAPGVIETDMIAHLPKEQILPLIPLQRLGTAEDIAAVVNFLCTEERMYIHGQVIGVNGGLAI